VLIRAPGDWQVDHRTEGSMGGHDEEDKEGNIKYIGRKQTE
jgi:hypothetical protein